ncbi:hypothetical protein HK098_004735 [Nowakowskiella sp. JEL0407]|nr:hypothetical protein HK098_004735 [Nowakowskiella sp. JEL0407]
MIRYKDAKGKYKNFQLAEFTPFTQKEFSQEFYEPSSCSSTSPTFPLFELPKITPIDKSPIDISPNLTPVTISTTIKYGILSSIYLTDKITSVITGISILEELSACEMLPQSIKPTKLLKKGKYRNTEIPSSNPRRLKETFHSPDEKQRKEEKNQKKLKLETGLLSKTICAGDVLVSKIVGVSPLELLISQEDEKKSSTTSSPKKSNVEIISNIVLKTDSLVENVTTISPITVINKISPIKVFPNAHSEKRKPLIVRSLVFSDNIVQKLTGLSPINMLDPVTPKLLKLKDLKSQTFNTDSELLSSTTNIDGKESKKQTFIVRIVTLTDNLIKRTVGISPIKTVGRLISLKRQKKDSKVKSEPKQKQKTTILVTIFKTADNIFWKITGISPLSVLKSITSRFFRVTKQPPTARKSAQHVVKSKTAKLNVKLPMLNPLLCGNISPAQYMRIVSPKSSPNRSSAQKSNRVNFNDLQQAFLQTQETDKTPYVTERALILSPRSQNKMLPDVVEKDEQATGVSAQSALIADEKKNTAFNESNSAGGSLFQFLYNDSYKKVWNFSANSSYGIHREIIQTARENQSQEKPNDIESAQAGQFETTTEKKEGADRQVSPEDKEKSVDMEVVLSTNQQTASQILVINYYVMALLFVMMITLRTTQKNKQISARFADYMTFLTLMTILVHFYMKKFKTPTNSNQMKEH